MPFQILLAAILFPNLSCLRRAFRYPRAWPDTFLGLWRRISFLAGLNLHSFPFVVGYLPTMEGETDVTDL